jgi:hypothetical protein
VLLIAPWTALWERNVFASMLPWLRDWMSLTAVRSGVAMVGLVTLVAGLADLWAILKRSRVRDPDAGRRPV